MLRSLRRVMIGIALLLVALLAALAVNQEPVSLRFLVWHTPQWSVFWWLFIAFAAVVADASDGYTSKCMCGQRPA